MSHPRTYQILVQYGFSPLKALEIMIDAKRGQRYALDLVKIAVRHELRSIFMEVGVGLAVEWNGSEARRQVIMPPTQEELDAEHVARFEALISK